VKTGDTPTKEKTGKTERNRGLWKLTPQARRRASNQNFFQAAIHLKSWNFCPTNGSTSATNTTFLTSAPALLWPPAAAGSTAFPANRAHCPVASRLHPPQQLPHPPRTYSQLFPRLHLRDVPLLHSMQDLETISILARHPQLLLSFRHALSKRNFLLGSKRNFSCGRDTTSVVFDRQSVLGYNPPLLEMLAADRLSFDTINESRPVKSNT
jgi:hypothetical protein